METKTQITVETLLKLLYQKFGNFGTRLSI